MNYDPALSALQELPEPYVVMGVGVPRSGKSTILQEVSSELGATYICPDDIREEMTGDASDQSRNSEVWDIARQRVHDSLAIGRSATLDATAANAEMRRRDIAIYRSFGAQAVAAVVVIVPLDTALQRNHVAKERSERHVPHEVIVRMHAALSKNPASVADGFDLITEIDNSKPRKIQS